MTTRTGDADDLRRGAGDAQLREEPRSFYASLAPDDLVRFGLPAEPTPEQTRLAAEIVTLDHRSLHSLGVRSMEREEVKRLLDSAVHIGIPAAMAGGMPGGVASARALLAHAGSIYWKHVQGKNRIHYLLGALMGVGVVAVLGAILIWSAVLAPYLKPELLPLLLIFASMGSFTSILTRLSKIDLRQETSRRMLYVSGATKPLTAMFFALVVFFILDLEVVSIQPGKAEAPNSGGVFIIAAFLCGFSERFAKDLLGSFERDPGDRDREPPQTGAPPGAQ